MTCCDSIPHICLLLLSIVLLSLSISTLIMSGQNVNSPNASSQYVFSAIILGLASLMFVVSIINIACSYLREPESSETIRMRNASGSAKPVTCTIFLVFIVSIVTVALTSTLLSPYYSETKMPIWYTASLLGISLIALIVSTSVIAMSCTCCASKDTANDETTQTPSYLMAPTSGTQTPFHFTTPTPSASHNNANNRL